MLHESCPWPPDDAPAGWKPGQERIRAIACAAGRCSPAVAPLFAAIANEQADASRCHWRAGDIGLMQAAPASHHYWRMPRPGAAPLLCHMALDRQQVQLADGRELELAAGSLLFHDLGVPLQLDCHGGGHLHLIAPRHHYPRLGELIRHAPLGVIVQSGPFEIAASAYLAMLPAVFEHHDEATATEAALHACQLLDTVSACRNGSLHGTDVMRHRMRVRAYIKRHVADPGLNVARLCRELGMSRSSLYRLFGQGVAVLIKEERLHIALLELLRCRRMPYLPEIAAKAGFASADRLQRAFRQRYGDSPVRYWRAHAARDPRSRAHLHAHR